MSEWHDYRQLGEGLAYPINWRYTCQLHNCLLYIYFFLMIPTTKRWMQRCLNVKITVQSEFTSAKVVQVIYFSKRNKFCSHTSICTLHRNHSPVHGLNTTKSWCWKNILTNLCTDYNIYVVTIIISLTWSSKTRRTFLNVSVSEL